MGVVFHEWPLVRPATEIYLCRLEEVWQIGSDIYLLWDAQIGDVMRSEAAVRLTLITSIVALDEARIQVELAKRRKRGFLDA